MGPMFPTPSPPKSSQNTWNKAQSPQSELTRPGLCCPPSCLSAPARALQAASPFPPQGLCAGCASCQGHALGYLCGSTARTPDPHTGLGTQRGSAFRLPGTLCQGGNKRGAGPLRGSCDPRTS